jgi:hypothetical protein
MICQDRLGTNAQNIQNNNDDTKKKKGHLIVLSVPFEPVFERLGVLVPGGVIGVLVIGGVLRKTRPFFRGFPLFIPSLSW